MKSLLALIAALGLFASTTFAGTYEYSKDGEALFQIMIPDNWSQETDDEGVVEASSPQENLTLSIWSFESSKTVEDLVGDLEDILKEYAKELKLDEQPKGIDVRGLPGLLIRGSGEDSEDGHPIAFMGVVVVVEDKAAIVFFEVNSDITDKETKTFLKIVESIAPPESK